MSGDTGLQRMVVESELARNLSSRAGAAVGVVTADAGEVFVLGKGIEASTPVEIGSVTKAFTGTLLAQAVQRGELTLESRVDEVVFGETWPGAKAISARLLATHQSGLPRLSLPPWRLLSPDPYRGYGRADLMAYLQRRRPRVPERLKYRYSNLGYAVLGLMLEKACGASYEELLQERVLGPLGMSNTHLQLTGGPERSGKGYRSGFFTPLGLWYLISRMATPLWHFDAYAPCGAVVSTLYDLIVALRAFLDPASVVAQALDFSAAPQAAIPGGTIGLAWHSPEGGDWVWHNGATYGHTSYLGVGRRRKAGVVVVANQSLPAQATQLGHQLMRILMQPE